MKQDSLFPSSNDPDDPWNAEDEYFDGETYDPALDQPRLTSQLWKVWAFMGDGHWHTLREIAGVVEGSEAGVSARLRDLRKRRFGRYTVERRRIIGGLWEYRLEPRE